jgi:hypothetical protein
VAPLNLTLSRLFARIAGSFLILVSLDASAAPCQEAKLTDSPIPKLEALEDVYSFPPFAIPAILAAGPGPILAPTPRVQPPKHIRHSRFTLDRPVMILGLVHGSSALYDGFTTKYFLHHCSSCVEVDPVSHFLLGSKPGWGGMIAGGSLEVIASTYLHQTMRHSPHKFVRLSAPLAPLALIAVHLVEGSRNLPLKNVLYCVYSTYVIAGTVCVLPSAAPTGSPIGITKTPRSEPSPLKK